MGVNQNFASPMRSDLRRYRFALTTVISPDRTKTLRGEQSKRVVTIKWKLFIHLNLILSQNCITSTNIWYFNMDNILLFFFLLFPHVVLWFREVVSVLRHSVYHEQHVINAAGDIKNTNNIWTQRVLLHRSSPIAIFQDLDWGISARRQSIVFPIPRRTRNYSNFEINSHLAVEIASTTTSQIAQRLHNSTSRRSLARSVIVILLSLSSSVPSPVIFYPRMDFSVESRSYCSTTDNHVVKIFPIVEQSFRNSFTRARTRIRSFQMTFSQSSSITTGISNKFIQLKSRTGQIRS